jgi:4-hydroxy-tetrahydrodipicolinate synthase
MFAGSLVALITPFKDGVVDVAKLAALVEFQIKNGTAGLVPCGTTGESVTMEEEEDQLVIRTVIEVAAGRVPVIAGTGSNDTASAVEYTKAAQRLGADGALVVTPYYNKPTQEGLYRHFEAIAAQTELPIVLYNVPGRTSVNMLPETVARLAKLDNVVAVKEASGNMDQVSAIVQACGPDFDVLSGDDSLTLPIMALGGRGVISVVANVAPAPTAEMVQAFLRGDLPRARELHYRLFDLCRAMFLETNPIPVKTAAGIMGLCSPELRLPLCPMGEANEKKLRQAMAAFGLIPAAV